MTSLNSYENLRELHPKQLQSLKLEKLHAIKEVTRDMVRRLREAYGYGTFREIDTLQHLIEESDFIKMYSPQENVEWDDPFTHFKPY